MMLIKQLPVPHGAHNIAFLIRSEGVNVNVTMVTPLRLKLKYIKYLKKYLLL